MVSNIKKKSKVLIHLLSQSAPKCLFKMQAKFYLSIIDDVIESIRELFLDEGLEDRLVDDLRHVSYVCPHILAQLSKIDHLRRMYLSWESGSHVF